MGRATSVRSYSAALKKLCTSDASGKQVFVPTSYYWWGIFYRKSNFAKWGVRSRRPGTSSSTCATSSRARASPRSATVPAATPRGSPPAWFDYLNMRVNGATFHRELLAGKHRFDDPEVRKVIDT